MSFNTLPVVAAIPNYEMAKSLALLLPKLTAQNYAEIFVLDDNSSDGSREVVEACDSSIHFIGGEENMGAGANRNRIISQLGHTSIIHFIDADMSPQTSDAPEVARDVLSDETLAFVGGMVTEANGFQNIFNYGPRMCLRSDIGALLQMYITSKIGVDTEKAAALRERYYDFVVDFPNLLEWQFAKTVFWCLESNMVIRSDVFESVGGFDPSLRNHEIQDLAIRLNKRGLHGRFDPAIEAMHNDVSVREGSRNLQFAKAELQIIRKIGLGEWLKPDGHFRPSLLPRV